MPLTLSIIPGYTDLSNTALAAESPAFGIHVEAITRRPAGLNDSVGQQDRCLV